MTISEKSAYLKGLMDGLKLDTASDEGKMIAAIVDLLGDLTRKVSDIEETTIAISDELDELEEDLDAIEDYILDEDEDEDDWDDDDDDDDDWDEDDEDDEDEDEDFDLGDEETIYEVECSCGNIIDFDEE
ncbi:MAG: transcriptional regulator, partial [Clostridiales bacterium]|nr:transcriptional regulator [Clostridiales bacterium]